VGEEFTVFGQTAKLSPQIYTPLTVHWQCHSYCQTRAIITSCVGRVLTQPLFKASTTFLHANIHEFGSAPSRPVGSHAPGHS